MGLVLLNEEDVRSLVDMPTAIAVLEEAFREWGNGKVDNTPRRRVRAPGVVLHQMSAACPYLGVVGWKTYTTTREGARFHVALYDQQSGLPIAVLEADWLGRLRTGAATGLAVRILADRDADRLAVIGCGRQAATQVEAVAAVRALSKVMVFCRNAERRTRFAREMEERIEIEVRPADSAEAAVRESPIVVTATTSREPVLADEWLAAGTLLCAVGSNWPHKREVAATTICRSRPVVCDDVEACRLEAGELITAAEAGWSWMQAVSLKDIVAGHVTASDLLENETAPRLFKSVGLAMEDVALATEAFRRLAKCRA